MSEPMFTNLSPWDDPNDILLALGRLREDERDQRYEAVRALLDHADPDIREEAGRVMFVVWKDRKLRRWLLRALTSDRSSAVRSTSAYGLAATSSGETRQEDLKLLISVLRNEDQPKDVRNAAYDALLILNRKPAFPSKMKDFDPVRDVDWTWIESLM